MSALDLDAAFDGPAIFANRFVIQVADSFVRIAFLEEPTPVEAPKFRGAFVISHRNASELLELIARTLGRHGEAEPST